MCIMLYMLQEFQSPDGYELQRKAQDIGFKGIAFQSPDGCELQRKTLDEVISSGWFQSPDGRELQRRTGWKTITYDQSFNPLTGVSCNRWMQCWVQLYGVSIP